MAKKYFTFENLRENPVGKFKPAGTLGRHFATIEQSVSPDDVLKAAQALLSSGKPFTMATQANVMVKAQKEGLDFADACEMNLL